MGEGTHPEGVSGNDFEEGLAFEWSDRTVVGWLSAVAARCLSPKPEKGRVCGD